MEDLYATEKKIMKSLINMLSQKLTEDKGYEISSEVAWGPTSREVRFDMVLRKDKFVKAIFEIKQSERGFQLALQRIPSLVFTKTTANILVIYLSKNKSFNIISKDSFNTQPFSYKTIYEIDGVIRLIEESSSEDNIKLIDYNSSNLNIEEPKFYEQTERTLDPEWCRNQLKQLKTKNEEDLKICRYSSLDSLFSTLNNMTFRMNGLPGMNDKNEGLYAWNIINDPSKMSNHETKRRKSLVNNAYIISYSSGIKIDDLAQWRLYGDDAKGVCCVYSVRMNMITERFYLHPVNYIEKPNDEKDVNDKLLQLFLNYVQKHSDLDFADLSPAIFFYKPKEYEYEDEVRLLFDNKETSAYRTTSPYTMKWLLTSANNIPNPYIDIPYKDFPLKLEKILLGPNINDIDTIQVQLETMLKQLGIPAVVEPSTISSYRTPTK